MANTEDDGKFFFLTHLNGHWTVYTEDECAGCGKKGKKKCGRCMEVKYCTRECQVADWRMHKLVCCPDSLGE